VIVVQDTAKPLPALNRSIHTGAVGQLLDQLVVEPLLVDFVTLHGVAVQRQHLVIALQVVVLRVLLHGLAKVTLAQRNDLGQTLGFDGMHKPLCICVQIGAPRREFHCLHT
jgi:hypothetical protein